MTHEERLVKAKLFYSEIAKIKELKDKVEALEKIKS